MSCSREYIDEKNSKSDSWIYESCKYDAFLPELKKLHAQGRKLNKSLFRPSTHRCAVKLFTWLREIMREEYDEMIDEIITMHMCSVDGFNNVKGNDAKIRAILLADYPEKMKAAIEKQGKQDKRMRESWFLAKKNK